MIKHRQDDSKCIEREFELRISFYISIRKLLSTDTERETKREREKDTGNIADEASLWDWYCVDV